jgi:hypothetical protein
MRRAYSWSIVDASKGYVFVDLVLGLSHIEDL